MKKLLILALMLTTSFSYAETCDELKADGVTKGLYGLCMAYCEGVKGPTKASEVMTAEQMEAMIGTNPKDLIDMRGFGKDVASMKILEQYNKRKKATDPDMPCVQSGSCPAFTQEDVDNIGKVFVRQYPLIGQTLIPAPLPTLEFYVDYSKQDDPASEGEGFVAWSSNQESSLVLTTFKGCGLDQDNNWICGNFGSRQDILAGENLATVLDLTEEQYQMCNSMLGNRIKEIQMSTLGTEFNSMLFGICWQWTQGYSCGIQTL